MVIDFKNIEVQATELLYCSKELSLLNVPNTYGMFHGACKSITSLQIHNIVTDKTDDMSKCFARNKKLKQLLINGMLVVSDTYINIGHNVDKKDALFMKACVANEVLMLSGVRRIDFTPLFGSKYEMLYMENAVERADELETINLGVCGSCRILTHLIKTW